MIHIAVTNSYRMVQMLTIQKYKQQNDKTKDFVSFAKKINRLKPAAMPKFKVNRNRFEEL